MYKKNKIHFVGIGGIGMSGIAEVLLNLGYPISGSDLKPSSTTKRLKKKGAKVFFGHHKKNIQGSPVMVVSSAIKKNNPELLVAQAYGLPIIQRAEMLAELMRFSKYGIAVAGTHGKTTTTSLIASILHTGGFDPTMIIGGRVNNFGSNARLGKGEFTVAEADESDGSFLKLSPTIEVITSIDPEHMDHYGDFEEVKKSFLDFTKKLPFYGKVVCCHDHPVVREMIPYIDKKVLTYGIKKKSDFMAKNISFQGTKTYYDLLIHGSTGGQKKGRVCLNLMGSHNVYNSLAALAVSCELDIPLVLAKKALREFQGIGRRCEPLLKNRSYTILDDYGHHPEEIKATLSGVRHALKGRLVVVFQPHRYTRTRDLFKDFIKCFDKSDLLILTDIYAASENPIPGVHSKKLFDQIKKRKRNVFYFPKNKKLADEVIQLVKPGDIILSLGAGDITYVGREIARKLKQR